MMKKGTIQLLVTVVFTIIFVILVFKVTAGFIKPLFWNDKNSVSYDNFKILTDNVNNLINTPTTTSMREITLQIEPKFKIIGFEAGSDTTKTCYHNFFKGKPIIGENYDKPDDCKQGMNCLCLFKEDEVVECKNFEKTIFHSQYGERSLVVESQGCEKETHPKSNYVNFGSAFRYEEIIFNGDLSVPTGVGSYKDVYWGVQNMYLENYKEGNKNYVLISPINDHLRERFKIISDCPEASDSKCRGYTYDEIDSKSTYVCKFNEEKNLCEEEPIEPCKDGLIEEECGCGKYAYDFGMCINNVFYFGGDISTEYCHINNIDKNSKCTDYPGKTQETKFACIYNKCRVNEKCSFDNGCSACKAKGDCSLYKDPISMFIDPCNYDNDPVGEPETDGCLDCSKVTTCNNYKTEDSCSDNKCEVKIKPTGSTTSRPEHCTPTYEMVYRNGNSQGYNTFKECVGEKSNK